MEHLLEGRNHSIQENEVIEINFSAWMSLLRERGQEKSLLRLSPAYLPALSEW